MAQKPLLIECFRPRHTYQPVIRDRVMDVAALLAFVACAVFLSVTTAGCSLVPTERSSTIDQKQRENVGQKATSEFVQSTKPAPTTVEVPQKDGKPIVVSVPAQSRTSAKAEVSESSDSQASGVSTWAESIPLFVKIIGLAIGIAALVGAVWFLRRSSVAVDTAWKTGDEFIGRVINRFKTEAMASSDPAVTSRLTSAVAEAERERTVFNKD